MAGDKAQDKQDGRKPITDFAQLRDDFTTIDVVIDRPDGGELVVTVKTLSYKEWMDIERAVPMPAPPVNGADRSGRPIYNEQDATYQRAVADAHNERLYRRIIAALQMDVPGDTIEEQMEAIGQLDTQLVISLGNVLTAAHLASVGRVEERARSFRKA